MKTDAESKGVSFFKMGLHIVVQATSTLLSRISGLIRDVVTAYYLGAGVISDAFFASFRVPNSIRKLIGEGPLSASFVPIFIEESMKNKKVAKEFAGLVFIIITLISAVIATLLFIFMPSFLRLIIPGLVKKPEAFELAIKLSRISIPFMALTCAVAVLGGITNANQSFFAFGITPLILNFSMTACALALGGFFPNRAFALSLGVTLGGVLQLFFMLYQCKKADAFPTFSLRPSNEARQSMSFLMSRLLAIVFGQGIFQINMFVDGIFASFTTKTQSYLYYSDRLSQFAITIIGHTLGMVSLPMISRYIKQNDRSNALKVQSKCISWSLLWSVPAAAGLFFLAHHFVGIIYQRGNFGQEDVFHVGNMLKITCLVIPIHAINKILYSSIYSLQRVGFAVITGVAAVATNLTINLLLMHRIQHYYVIISSAVSALVEFAMLWWALGFRYKFLGFRPKGFLPLFIIIPASLCIGKGALFLFDSIPTQSILLKLFIIIPLAVLTYLGTTSLTGIINLEQLISLALKRGTTTENNQSLGKNGSGAAAAKAAKKKKSEGKKTGNNSQLNKLSKNKK